MQLSATAKEAERTSVAIVEAGRTSAAQKLETSRSAEEQTLSSLDAFQSETGAALVEHGVALRNRLKARPLAAEDDAEEEPMPVPPEAAMPSAADIAARRPEAELLLAFRTDGGVSL